MSVLCPYPKKSRNFRSLELASSPEIATQIILPSRPHACAKLAKVGAPRFVHDSKKEPRAPRPPCGLPARTLRKAGPEPSGGGPGVRAIHSCLWAWPVGQPPAQARVPVLLALFVPQRHHGIDPRRPTGGHEAGRERNGGHQERRQGVGSEVSGTHAVENAGEVAGKGPGAQ